MSNNFGKNEILEFHFNYPTNNSNIIDEISKIGEKLKQYVETIYYLDTLSFSYDKTEIYSSLNDDEYSPVYSSYHSDCDYCKEYKNKIRENLIIGYKIYPVGMKPKQDLYERKQEWKKFL